MNVTLTLSGQAGVPGEPTQCGPERRLRGALCSQRGPPAERRPSGAAPRQLGLTVTACSLLSRGPCRAPWLAPAVLANLGEAPSFSLFSGSNFNDRTTQTALDPLAGSRFVPSLKLRPRTARGWQGPAGAGSWRALGRPPRGSGQRPSARGDAGQRQDGAARATQPRPTETTTTMIGG